MIAPNNPFTNPELLHPQLAADIAETEAWQAEHTIGGETIAMGGLSDVVQHELADTDSLKLSAEQMVFVENLRSQLDLSITAASLVTTELNMEPSRHYKQLEINEAKVQTEFDDKLGEWAHNGSLDWAIEYQERCGGSFTLVATPNVLASAEEIMSLAKNFGEEQPEKTYTYDRLLIEYTSEQLSGTKPDTGQSVMFSLIPSVADPNLKGT